VLTADEVRALPATVDVPTAGRCFGLGRDASYQAARDGSFPVPVLRLGQRLRVTRSDLMAVLGISEPSRAPSGLRDRAGIEPGPALDNEAVVRSLALMLFAFRTAIMVSRQQLADALDIDVALLAKLEAGEAQ
jgi:hypothetical protein